MTSKTNCPFCSPNIDDRIILECCSVAALLDSYPVTQGHVLIVPLRHTESYFTMDEIEVRDLDQILYRLRKKILAEDPTVTGFNVGTNVGFSAGQTVMHAHFHLIPRRDGDVPDPRGGVRGVIPEKQKY